MADLASRSFKHTGVKGNYDLTDAQFLTQFNAEFPLEQGASWLMLRHMNSMSSRVCTLLRNETPNMGSWTRLPKSGCAIGLTGATSADGTIQSIQWTPFSETLKKEHGLTSSELSLASSVKGMQEEDIKSELARFRQRFQPSARPSTWNEASTPASKTK
jgi:hypothetical protein